MFFLCKFLFKKCFCLLSLFGFCFGLSNNLFSGGRSLSRRPSAADALTAPPPPADPSGAALPRMMADF